MQSFTVVLLSLIRESSSVLFAFLCTRSQINRPELLSLFLFRKQDSESIASFFYTNSLAFYSPTSRSEDKIIALCFFLGFFI